MEKNKNELVEWFVLLMVVVGVVIFVLYILDMAPPGNTWPFMSLFMIIMAIYIRGLR